jgi:inosine/xanthosine triphosphate pyrophosphatase family protein
MYNRQLLCGTRNPSRVAMVRLILREHPVQVLTLDDLGIKAEILEDGSTPAENAAKKARGYYQLSGVPTIALDGGLYIDRFPPEKQPGALVKRQNGFPNEAEPGEVMAYYQRELAAVGGESMATWTGGNALVLSLHQVQVESFTFQVRFTVHAFGRPHPGLVLDPLMIDPLSGRYFTEIPLPERPYFARVKAFIEQYFLDAGQRRFP